MADSEAKKSGSSDAFASCVVDHHALVNKEEAYPDVYLHVDEKNVQTAHYYVLKSSPYSFCRFRGSIPSSLEFPPTSPSFPLSPDLGTLFQLNF